jgi:hypothetical protein
MPARLNAVGSSPRCPDSRFAAELEQSLARPFESCVLLARHGARFSFHGESRLPLVTPIRCPVTRQFLTEKGGQLVTEDGCMSYQGVHGIPDFRLLAPP